MPRARSLPKVPQPQPPRREGRADGVGVRVAEVVRVRVRVAERDVEHGARRRKRVVRVVGPAAVDDAGGKSGGKGAKYGGFRGGRGDTSGGDASAVRPLRSEAASKAAACDAFFALADAMRRKNRVGVGITARTGSRDAGARGCVLVPAEDADGEIVGLRVIDAPFADDIRYPERNHDFAGCTRRLGDGEDYGSSYSLSAIGG